jgi:hypothetical protein
MRTLQAQPAESEQKLSYVALADLVVEAFDEVGAALPQVQQHALAGALVREDAGGGASARTTATAFVGGQFDDCGFRSLLAAHIARSVQMAPRMQFLLLLCCALQPTPSAAA